MSMWFTVKVRFTKEFQDGTLKRVTEPYLVQALSFTEAEARIYEQVGEFVKGEFTVSSVAITSIADIFQYDDSETWYLCKGQYMSNDDNGKEKKTVNSFLVTASTSKEAYERMEESLKDTLSAFEIPAINKSPLINVFPYEEEQGEAKPKSKKKKKAPAKGVKDALDKIKKSGAQITVTYGNKKVPVI